SPGLGKPLKLNPPAMRTFPLPRTVAVRLARAIDRLAVCVGGWLTVIDTVACAEVARPSDAVKVKLSRPKKPATGVYVRAGGVPVSVPCEGGVATVKVNASLSASDPVIVMRVEVF